MSATHAVRECLSTALRAHRIMSACWDHLCVLKLPLPPRRVRLDGLKNLTNCVSVFNAIPDRPAKTVPSEEHPIAVHPPALTRKITTIHKHIDNILTVWMLYAMARTGVGADQQLRVR
jgi:hypothetical protein